MLRSRTLRKRPDELGRVHSHWKTRNDYPARYFDRGFGLCDREQGCFDSCALLPNRQLLRAKTNKASQRQTPMASRQPRTADISWDRRQDPCLRWPLKRKAPPPASPRMTAPTPAITPASLQPSLARRAAGDGFKSLLRLASTQQP